MIETVDRDLNAQRFSRLVGFDVIRLISFFIISFYHFLYAVWRERVPDFNAQMPNDPFFWHGVYPALRSLSFSGHTILWMSAMLIGLARKNFGQTLRLCVFLFLAWMGFVWAESDFQGFTPFWDIHPLILLGLITIAFAEKMNPRLVLALGVLGFLATWISFWQWDVFHSLPIGLRSTLVGDCEAEVSSWPVLPWLGFLWFGYASGFLLRDIKIRTLFSRASTVEWLAWAVVLIPSALNLGAFYKLDALNDWECHAFRLPPLDFWSHFIFVMFAIRVSLLSRVNELLTRKLPILQKLHVSKNFFLAYALQYVLGFVVAWQFGAYLRTHPLAFTLTGLCMLPLAEAVARLASPARKLFKGPSHS